MRQYVQVEGSAGQGFVRYRICVSVDGVMLKPASCDLRVIVNGIENTIAKGDTFPLVEAPCSLPQFPSPRLLLGCNKASNWDRISDAPTMDEVLPLWYQLSPQASEESLESSTTLFGAIVEAFKKKETSTILSTFATYFRAGMAGYFVPKRTDNLFLGYGIPLLPDEMSLQDVHTGICTMVRSLFLREEGNIIEILPCLPKELVSGRLLHETLHSGHQIDIEWRKGRVRRVHLYAQHDGMVTVKADAVTATLRRLRSADRKTVFRLGEEIEVQEGKHYLLDNFTT